MSFVCRGTDAMGFVALPKRNDPSGAANMLTVKAEHADVPAFLCRFFNEMTGESLKPFRWQTDTRGPDWYWLADRVKGVGFMPREYADDPDAYINPFLYDHQAAPACARLLSLFGNGGLTPQAGPDDGPMRQTQRIDTADGKELRVVPALKGFTWGCDDLDIDLGTALDTAQGYYRWFVNGCTDQVDVNWYETSRFGFESVDGQLGAAAPGTVSYPMWWTPNGAETWRWLLQAWPASSAYDWKVGGGV